ncbi:PepSY-like domain-containing protein [Apibacter raozihei]|uniref:PepSY-like domain-containing protein n=1 Tax=Apibacter raozihei TaxID=2500547 RepID=UPI000FE38758|nr:PepSY-like domain-containing protein [Apibacter raozihei]
MKKYLFLSVIVALSYSGMRSEMLKISNHLIEQLVTQQNVPGSAQRYIAKNYPEAYDIRWEYKAKEGLYKCEFKVRGEKYKITFTPKGKQVFFKGMISTSQLPAKIKRFIKKYYPDHQIVKSIETRNYNQSFYEIKLGSNIAGKHRSKNLKFNQQGKLMN